MSSLQKLSGAVQRVTAQLRHAGVDAPRRDARLLVAKAIGADVSATITQPDRPLSPGEQAALEDLAAQRAARKPMAQILGVREFWSLDFHVSPDVLVPRPDSETLVAAVLGHIPDCAAPLRLLDLGTGSGCLLLALLSELPAAHGVGVDISGPAIAVARRNAEALGLAQRAVFAVSHWTAGLAGPFDIVVSNPPYIATADLDALMPEVAQYDPRQALAGGADGLDAYRAIFPGLIGLLAPTGLVALEIGASQGAAVVELAAQRGFAALSHHRDLAGIARCLVLHHGEKHAQPEKTLGKLGVKAYFSSAARNV